MLKIEIATDSDAFGVDEYEKADELARIIREQVCARLAVDTTAEGLDIPLRDFNGARVGRAWTEA
jgi:hypothetical protein